MTRAELLKQAAECEARMGKLSALADKLAKAHDLLDSHGPIHEGTIDAPTALHIVAARYRTWTAVDLITAEIKALRAEQARLVTEAEKVA